MYNRSLASDYAQKWALKRNPVYADFENLGGDCTNFISQCLYSGGIDFANYNMGWYYYSLFSRSSSWSGVDELFNFAINNKNHKGPKFDLILIEELEIGDIIQIKVGYEWTHSLIVTKIKKPISLNNIFVSCHSSDALNRMLATYKYNDIRYCKVFN